jgi:hypothetical protein
VGTADSCGVLFPPGFRTIEMKRYALNQATVLSAQTSDEKIGQVFSGKTKDWLEVRGTFLHGTIEEKPQNFLRPLMRV